MTIAKYVGMDVHKESISIAVMNSTGKFVMECVIETKASMLLQFIDRLRGDVRITFEEGTWAAWLYDLLKPHVWSHASKTVLIGAQGISCNQGSIPRWGFKWHSRRTAELSIFLAHPVAAGKGTGVFSKDNLAGQMIERR